MANQRSLDIIFEKYYSVKCSTLQLFQNLPEAAFSRKGNLIASNRKRSNTKRLAL